MLNEQQSQDPQGVQSLYSGVNHNASWERSYNADGRVYSTSKQIQQDWLTFMEQSHAENRRRAIMRCYVSKDIFNQITDLPIEAAVPIGNEFLIWIGQNQHTEVSTVRNVRILPHLMETPLSTEYRVDDNVLESDVANLTDLWGQFGWSPDAIRNFVRNHANGNPIALIRTMEQEAIGVMIAESVEFGLHRLVEITELAVNPNYRGQNLAVVLIKEISRLSLERWEDALVFGEYNLTTKSYQSAAKAGQISGQTQVIDGILHDHVGIETGSGNKVIEPWNTRWLHNFLVMYQPNRSILK